MFEIHQLETSSPRFRISKNNEDGAEIARAQILIITNKTRTYPYGLLDDVFTHEDHRGKGHGKEVVRQALEKAALYGCDMITLNCKSDNRPAKKMYSDLGFEVCDEGLRLYL